MTHRSAARHQSPTAPGITRTSREMEDTSAVSSSVLEDSGNAEGDVSDTYYPSSFISNGSSEHVKNECETDSGNVNPLVEKLESKIERTKNRIRTEQRLRDGTFLWLGILVLDVKFGKWFWVETHLQVQNHDLLSKSPQNVYWVS